MKLKLPFKYIIRINRQYKPNKVVVPVGYDCHPAYLLNKKTLRKQSFPFDWLLTSPLLALDYAYFNIKNNFLFFLTHLKKNNEGKVYAEKYPESTFYHYDDLITNKSLQEKIRKRCDRLLKLYRNEAIYFLFVIPSVSLESDQSVKQYSESIQRFLSLIKDSDELLVYVRFENSLEENEVFYGKLMEEVKDLKKLKIATFILQSDQYGLWGNESKYSGLLKDLKIQQKQIFPKISLSKIK